MQDSFFYITVAAFGVFCVVFILLLAYEDGIPMGGMSKLLCKMGLHKYKERFGHIKMRYYYCPRCKKPRKHPKLAIIEGRDGIKKNAYKF